MKGNNKLKVLYVLIVIAVVFSIYAGVAFKNDSLLDFFDDRDVYRLNHNWEYIDKEGKNEYLNLPVRLGEKSQKTTIISNTIPSDFKDNMILCFRTVAQNLQVEIDGKQIYSYALDNSLFLQKTPGSVWNIIEVPNGSQGKKITFIFSSAYKIFDGYINPVIYGYKNAIYIKIIGDNILGIITCSLMFLIGICFLILYFIDRIINNRKSNLIYLACFAILNSIWIFTQSKQLVQFFIGNQSLIGSIIFSSLTLSTISIFLFIGEVCKNKNKIIFNIMYAIFVFSYLFSIVLQIFKIADFFETIFMFHIALFISLFISGYSLYYELIIYKNKTIKPIVFSISVMLCFTLFELISFYMNAFDNITLYSKFGLLVLLIYLTYVYIKIAYQTIKETNEAKYFEKLAYIDMLTQSKNRNAFNLEFSSITQKLDDKSNIIVIMFDLNKLKYINDNFGHKAGDNALIACYNCINSAFYPIQKIYRIGGDEFVCIVEDATEKEILEKIETFKKCTVEHSKKLSYPYSIAYGYAKYDIDIDNNINDTLNRADKKMYETKKENNDALEKNII